MSANVEKWITKLNQILGHVDQVFVKIHNAICLKSLHCQILVFHKYKSGFKDGAQVHWTRRIFYFF